MGKGFVRARHHRLGVGWAEWIQSARFGNFDEAAQTYKTGEQIVMTRIGKILWIGIGLLTLLFLSFSSYHSTDSTEVGVRTIKWFGKRGVEQKVYQPGSAYFFLPVFSAWDTFDTRLQ